jgi:hypothetical protein
MGCGLALLTSLAAGGLACSTSAGSSVAPGLSRIKDAAGLSEGRDTSCFAAAWLRSARGRAAEVSSIGWLGRSCSPRPATSNDPIFSVGVSDCGNGHRRLATSPAAAQANTTAANIKPRRTILVAAPDEHYLIRNQSTVETFRHRNGGSARSSPFSGIPCRRSVRSNSHGGTRWGTRAPTTRSPAETTLSPEVSNHGRDKLSTHERS